jgi:hypothetical protein
MKQYQGHPIYGVAVPGPTKRWTSRGLVFGSDLQSSTEVLKRLNGREDLTFNAKEQAEKHGLELCKAWIDEQTSAGKGIPLI